MNKLILLPVLALLAIIATSCQKAEDLAPAQTVMVKFVNKTGKNLEALHVSQANVGYLDNGSSSSYLSYESLGEQYGYALVETVATIDETRYYTASACQGVCGTASAPDGEWLQPGYYKISVHISNEPGGNYLVFRMMNH